MAPDRVPPRTASGILSPGAAAALHDALEHYVGNGGDEGALRAWLIRVCTNRALSLRRSQVRVVHLEVVPESASGGDLGTDAGDRLALLAGIAKLPPRTRAAIVLRYYADLPVAEVADVLGRSPNTIKTQLREALAMLREGLAEAGPANEPEVRRA